MSRFEWGALDDEQPKILRCRNPCGLGEGRKQRWDGQTHGQGLGLLMVDLVAQGTLMLGGLSLPRLPMQKSRTDRAVSRLPACCTKSKLYKAICRTGH